MTVFNGKTQGFQRLSEDSVGFALIQLHDDKVALFSGDYSALDRADFSKPQLFAPDFFRKSPKSWWSFIDFEILSLSELEDWAENQLDPEEAPLKWEEPTFNDFSSQVNRIERAFEEHSLHKAVPTVFAAVKRTEKDISILQMLARAVLNRGQRKIYALSVEGDGILGATPETLFEFDSKIRNVQSMALAGTRASELEKAEPLLSDPKEIHEHNLVLFEIKEKLAAFGEVHTGETRAWNIGALTHLLTEVSVVPKEKEPSKLFSYLERSLHPTPALGVSSDSLDFTWLKDLPGARERYRFGAPFGCWIPEVGARVLVAIRNIQWTDEEWLLGSGCGYVPASKIDKEWKELELKRASVRALFEAR